MAVPQWARRYICRLDVCEALGIDVAIAHETWDGDPKLAERCIEYCASYSRAKVDPPEYMTPEQHNDLDDLRVSCRERATTAFPADTKALSAAWLRGVAAFDETTRPVVFDRARWGSIRAGALGSLAATNARPHEAYIGDDDLLDPRHPSYRSASGETTVWPFAATSITKAARSDLAFIKIGKAMNEAASGAPAKEQRFALGPVLIPDVPDLQGDVVSAEEIEATERRFMEAYQNTSDQHAVAPGEIAGFRDANPDLANGKIVIVESYIVRDDRGYAVINGRRMPAGTWIMGCFYRDEKLWQDVKAGKKTGYSIGGLAKRTPIEKASSK